MSRVNIVEGHENLDELIPIYALNKLELDSYKKLCDKDNARIKSLMSDLNVDNYTIAGYTAKKTVVVKESMDNDKLVCILNKYGITEAIKTIEVADLDALENYLYNNEISAELSADLDKCRVKNEVVQLRITKEKVNIE